ncbi:MAG: right-handed parallel beta-helix repeat-containing protein [Verrucomicrobiota bacterium]|nr:right-handed parallel beta-helix repeat-containing protein [Verrucomicrobiota bacterium]
MKKPLAKKHILLVAALLPVFAQAFSVSLASDAAASGGVLDVWIVDGKIDGKSYYVVTQDVRLMPAGATFNGQIQIAAKDVVLEGNHCIIDGADFHGDALSNNVPGMAWNSLYFPENTTRFFKYIGIVAQQTNGVDQPAVDISGTIIKNCIIKNWSNHGIYLRRVKEQDSNDFDGDGNLTEEIPEEAYFNGSDRGLLYKHATRHIKLINMEITRNGRIENPATGNLYATGDGIFVPAYSEFYFMQNLEVTESGAVGIYLERESRFSTIINCEIHHNWREGIAIDASAHNMISHNELYYNNWVQDFPVRAGIKLYKNAGESGVKRYQHSSFNQIFHNTMHDERTGVWVASRQASENAEERWNFNADELGEETFSYNGDDGTMMDYARHNVVAYNDFYNNAHSHVKVEDDFTVIVKNVFGNRDNGSGHTCDINLGNPFRNERGRPVSGTAIVGNTWSTAATQTLLYDASIRTTSDELYSDDGITSSDDAALDRKGIYSDWGYDGTGYLSDQLL